MHPVLLKLGRITIYSYGLMMALAIISGILIALYRGKKRGTSPEVITDISFYGVIGGIVGAKLFYIIISAPYVFRNPEKIFEVLSSGFVVYGSIIGGVLAGYIYCRKKKLNFFEKFDIIAPSLAFAQGVGRIGCFLAGCCYGRETDCELGVVFKNSLYAPNGVRLIPTQLISSAGDFLIAAVLMIYARKKRMDGRVAGLYLILYSIGRFLVEFLRNDPRGNIYFLSSSQFICIFVLIGGIIIFRRKGIFKNEPR